MFPGVAHCPNNGADSFAGVTGMKIVEQIAKRSKIFVSFVAVHAAVDGEIPNITLGKELSR